MAVIHRTGLWQGPTPRKAAHPDTLLMAIRELNEAQQSAFLKEYEEKGRAEVALPVSNTQFACFYPES